MMALSFVLVASLAAAFFAPCSGVPVDAYLLQPLTVAGTVEVVQTLETLQGNVNSTVTEFIHYNRTVCAPVIERRSKECGQCIADKCTTRAKKLQKQCADSFSLAIIKLLDFGKNIEKLLSNTIPNLVVDQLGGHIIDAGKEIANFFTGTLVDGISSLGGNILSGVSGVTVDLTSLLTNVGKQILGGVTDAGKWISGTTIDIGKGLVSGISSVGKSIGKLFGRRKRSMYARQALLALYMRGGEPGCGDFGSEAQAQKACLYYLAPCTSQGPCDISREKDCPGYSKYYNAVLKAQAATKWMCHISDLTYGVTSADYNPATFTVDPQTGMPLGYQGVQVGVTLFGKKKTFTLADPINIFEAPKAGPYIAKVAMQWFRQVMASTPCPVSRT